MESGALYEIFSKLGLTEYETKTLITILKKKEATAPEISIESEVPKTRVYDILERLKNLGLIIELSGRPKKYKTIGIEETFNKLLSIKKKELEELEKKMEKLKVEFNDTKNGEKEKVIKLKTLNDLKKILEQEMKKANKSIYGFIKTKSEYEALLNALTSVEKPLDVKILTSKKELAEKLKELNVDAKHSDHSISGFIIDNKKLILALNDLEKNQSHYHLSIWNENEHLNNMFSNHFSKVWNKK